MQFRTWLENDIYYHGSPKRFDQFDYTYIGDGHDQEGPGFYFTNSESDGLSYAGKAGHLYKANLKLDRLVPTQGPVNVKEIEWLMRKAPDLEESLTDWGEYPESAFQEALSAMAGNADNHYAACLNVWADFYMRQGADAEYLKNMTELGYDGVVIQKKGDLVHTIVFSPENIELTN